MIFLLKCLRWHLYSLLLVSSQGWSAEGAVLRGDLLGLEWIIPFAGVLLSIAFLPLFAPHVWHRHYGKISAGWSVLTALLLGKSFGFLPMITVLSGTLIHHYLPFILMIGALYIITGGIRLTIQATSTPILNTLILGVGTLFSSVIGTTGASMLLIQPFLNLNKERQVRHHLVVFFIILVSNIGGGLSPIGDPPLLLGFLKGVPFFWPLIHLFWPFMIIFLPILSIFYGVDRWFFYQEKGSLKKISKVKFSLAGYDNIVLLGIAILCLFVSEFSFLKQEVNLFEMQFTLGALVRDLSFIGLAIISLKVCQQKARRDNNFGWGPLKEVMILFAAIFITVEPVLAMLKVGEQGLFTGLYHFLTDAQGEPLTKGYFWLTGILSSFLDNAPTYLIFFNLAGGDVLQLTTTHAITLIAISSGAVFMGALTYIGNAPNFMVKSIAEANAIEMPSFFRYTGMVSLILIPLFMILAWFFF